MKNLSVGKKILTGFMAVILMIVVIVVATGVTSISRNSDLERVNTISAMQREINAMSEEFMLARVEIRSVFTAVNADTEYEQAMSYLRQAQARLNTITTYSDELGGYLPQVKQLGQMFDTVETDVTSVYKNDAFISEATANMESTSQDMAQSATDLFALVIDITQNAGVTDPGLVVSRLDSVVVPSQEMGNLIDEIRITSQQLTMMQKKEAILTIYELLDKLDANAAALRTVLTTADGRAAIDSVLNASEGFRGSVTHMHETLLVSDDNVAHARETFLELSDLIESTVNTIAQDVATVNAQTMKTSNIVAIAMVIIGIVTAIFSVFVAIFLGKLITRPLGKMKMVMAQAGDTGNLDFSEEVRSDILKEASAKDEIGESLAAFAKFVDRMVYISQCLQSVADRDLSIDVNLLGSNDTMGLAIQEMLTTLNSMFAEINRISKQVAASSSEISLGAQNLAQGSTEQAATVQQISSSVNSINDQMNISNETASSAAHQATGISNVALEGNEKMKQMVEAMQEITDASQAIGRVIKVIDDIAFQTNILSLNASVEAARAGQHGRGFAVVADEVRNLAQKSADAAKETAALISSNIEKTELGMAFTQETARSLSQIIEGVAQANQSMQMIAEQTLNARMATAEVNQAITQVAQVVQQNSATSEESAAASEEMSSMANILKSQIAQFKLRKEFGNPQVSLPAPTYVSDDSAENTYGDSSKYDL